MKNALITSLLLLFVFRLQAQDPPRKSDQKGSKDYPTISRYKGAVIQEYDTVNYGEFYLGLDKPVRKDFKGRGLFFNKYLTVKGKIINTQYLIPFEEGVLKVYENYKNALQVAGYKILYIEDSSEYNNFYHDDYYNYLIGFPKAAYGINTDKYYYIVAKGVKDGIDVYVNLYIAVGGNYGQDFIVVNQSIIETTPLELGLVTADNIAQNMENAGHAAIYDIHFAVNSAEIDSKSDSQMQNIATYLQAHPEQQFFIVGHTDNTGEFLLNKKLSEDRANAVMNQLITKYHINPDQLLAYGVANLAPVTSNKTDEGKARNRRVEIVLR